MFYKKLAALLSALLFFGAVFADTQTNPNVREGFYVGIAGGVGAPFIALAHNTDGDPSTHGMAINLTRDISGKNLQMKPSVLNLTILA